MGLTLSWVFLEWDGTGRRSRPPGIWQMDEGHMGEGSKSDQAPRNCDLCMRSAQSATGKIQQAHPTAECKSATPENKGTFGQGKTIIMTSKAQLMSHSQRIRSGAAATTLNLGLSPHCRTPIFTTTITIFPSQAKKNPAWSH